MVHRFSRTEMLIGREGLDILAKSRVAVFGIGGVGSFAAEALHGPAWAPWYWWTMTMYVLQI